MESTNIKNVNAALSACELEELLKWVDGFQLPRSRKKLCRDFADGVLLAEILKFELPKLVDLHNYPSANSLKIKMNNWETLNQKVLKKLQIDLKPEDIEKLARAETNYIESVLFDIMNKTRLMKLANSIKPKASQANTSTDVMTITITRQIGDHVKQFPQQMILLSIYEKLLENFESQQQLIAELNEKNDDLQKAIELKSQIIDNLHHCLEKEKEKSGTHHKEMEFNQTLSISAIRNRFQNFVSDW